MKLNKKFFLFIGLLIFFFTINTSFSFSWVGFSPGTAGSLSNSVHSTGGLFHSSGWGKGVTTGAGGFIPFGKVSASFSSKSRSLSSSFPSISRGVARTINTFSYSPPTVSTPTAPALPQDIKDMYKRIAERIPEDFRFTRDFAVHTFGSWINDHTEVRNLQIFLNSHPSFRINLRSIMGSYGWEWNHYCNFTRDAVTKYQNWEDGISSSSGMVDQLTRSKMNERIALAHQLKKDGTLDDVSLKDIALPKIDFLDDVYKRIKKEIPANFRFTKDLAIHSYGSWTNNHTEVRNLHIILNSTPNWRLNKLAGSPGSYGFETTNTYCNHTKDAVIEFQKWHPRLLEGAASRGVVNDITRRELNALIIQAHKMSFEDDEDDDTDVGDKDDDSKDAGLPIFRQITANFMIIDTNEVKGVSRRNFEYRMREVNGEWTMQGMGIFNTIPDIKYEFQQRRKGTDEWSNSNGGIYDTSITKPKVNFKSSSITVEVPDKCRDYTGVCRYVCLTIKNPGRPDAYSSDPKNSDDGSDIVFSNLDVGGDYSVACYSRLDNIYRTQAVRVSSAFPMMGIDGYQCDCDCDCSGDDGYKENKEEGTFDCNCDCVCDYSGFIEE